MNWHDYVIAANGRRFPVIEVELIFPSKPPIVTQALVDSGADTSSFDLSLAEAAGINPDKYPEEIGTGAGGNFAYRKIPVEIRFNNEVINTRASFRSVFDGKGERVVGLSLLGREDFFSAYDLVVFNENSKKLGLKQKTLT